METEFWVWVSPRLELGPDLYICSLNILVPWGAGFLLKLNSTLPRSLNFVKMSESV